ncbi:MAG: hypothetical protein PVH40_01095 [Gemmatimonadales bacterium]|jgi:hypothetical protein
MVSEPYRRKMRRAIALAAAVVHLGVMSVGVVAHAFVHLTAPGGTTAGVVASLDDAQPAAGHHHCAFCQTLAGSSALPDGSHQVTGPDAHVWNVVPQSLRLAARESGCLPLGARAPPSA